MSKPNDDEVTSYSDADTRERPAGLGLPGARGEPSRRIGPYRILRSIGEGGMGVVYEAEQEKPVRRNVALKLVKWGMDTKSVVARFESERQALALMNHPNIASVYDAGATDEGRPYFAMECVRGVPIAQYCDTHRLTVKERLELFIRVCEGVQHAHQKGIIHRDLKPSNILVTVQDGRPVPKIIDFGIAKAISQRLTEHSLFTELGQVIGTPEYMSPEQAEMTNLDIDTQTDVYSLGVVLYELLVGALPFDGSELRAGGLIELQRKLREQEPPRPSTRVSRLGKASTTSASNRRVEPRGLVRALRGDLDWITMKALEKDRTRRYASPNDLAADLTRHLNHEPVIASPSSAPYRAAKFVRRHRLGVAATAVAVLALVGFAVRERIQATRIAREARAAEQVSAFLVRLFEVSNPSEARGNRVTAREILDRGAAQIERELAGEPLVQARLMSTLGNVYRGLGLFDQARPFLERTLIERRGSLGEEHPDTLASMKDLGSLYRQQGRFDAAEPLLTKALETGRRLYGNDGPETLALMNNLANLYRNQGRRDQAESLYRETVEGARRVLGENNPDTLFYTYNLANLYGDLGRFDDAEPLFRVTLESQRRVLGGDHPQTLRAINALALLYRNRGRYDEAEPLFKEAVDTQIRVLGEAHVETLASMHNLAILHTQRKRPGEAETLYRKILDIQVRVLGEDHPEATLTMNNLAVLYQDQRRYDEARQLLERAIAITEKARGTNDARYPVYIHTLGELSQATGNLAEAERQLRRAVEIYESRGGHRLLGLGLYQLAGLSALQRRPEQALDFLHQALKKGWADESIVEDDNLDSLRGRADFEVIVSEVKSRIANAKK